MIVILFKGVQAIINISSYYQIPIKTQYQPFQNSTEQEPTWKLENLRHQEIFQKRREQFLETQPHYLDLEISRKYNKYQTFTNPKKNVKQSAPHVLFTLWFLAVGDCFLTVP